jgi:hypothetical protein
MDTFGGKPTKREGSFLFCFILLLAFGLGAIFGAVVGHYL